jgi:hypothetical protein
MGLPNVDSSLLDLTLQWSKWIRPFKFLELLYSRFKLKSYLIISLCGFSCRRCGLGAIVSFRALILRVDVQVGMPSISKIKPKNVIN